MEPHLERMIDSARAMAFEDIPSIDSIKRQVFNCLAANGMRDGVHVRLTLSRGEKTTRCSNVLFFGHDLGRYLFFMLTPFLNPACQTSLHCLTLVSAR